MSQVLAGGLSTEAISHASQARPARAIARANRDMQDGRRRVAGGLMRPGAAGILLQAVF
jgi:hypothetical protein